jgi:hypothetical protein
MSNLGGTKTMKRTAFRLAAWTLGLAGILSVAGQTARAEFFSYTSTVNVTTDGSTPASSGGAAAALATIPAGTLNFIANSEVGPLDASQPGGADIDFGNIDFNPSLLATTTAPYSVNFNYQVVFTFAGGPATVNFTGTQSGDARGNPRFINSNFASFAVTPASVTVAGEIYEITFKSATGPGSGGITLGTLQGNVTLRSVPEPGSVALLGVGLAGAFGIYRRRARKA